LFQITSPFLCVYSALKLEATPWTRAEENIRCFSA